MDFYDFFNHEFTRINPNILYRYSCSFVSIRGVFTAFWVVFWTTEVTEFEERAEFFESSCSGLAGGASDGNGGIDPRFRRDNGKRGSGG